MVSALVLPGGEGVVPAPRRADPLRNQRGQHDRLQEMSGQGRGEGCALSVQTRPAVLLVRRGRADLSELR